MISGASEEELTEAIGRADVLLEFMPKIKQLQKENKQLKEEYNEIQKAYESTFSDYQQLKNSWNKLKEIMEEETREYWNTNILEIMQKIEGSNSNGNN